MGSPRERRASLGIHIGEAAPKALVLPVLAEAVFLVVRAHVERALVSRAGGAPSKRSSQVADTGCLHDSVGGDFLTARACELCTSVYLLRTLPVTIVLPRQIRACEQRAL